MMTSLEEMLARLQQLSCNQQTGEAAGLSREPKVFSVEAFQKAWRQRMQRMQASVKLEKPLGCLRRFRRRSWNVRLSCRHFGGGALVCAAFAESFALNECAA